jgi:hypothetical protein
MAGRGVFSVRSPRLSLLAAASWSLIALLTLALQAHGKTREDCEKSFKPHSGQAGKDVVWVPTSDGLVTRMLEMARVTPNDLVYDLGAGDGKIPIAAARQFGAKAVGIEYNPDMAQLAQCYVEVEGVQDRVRIIQGDIFESDFSDATVVTLYLLPELNLRLRPTLLGMKPGTRVVSHSFLMDDWEPDERSISEDGQAYLWIVPADVKGRWTFRREDGKDRFVVDLDQRFQQLHGRAGRSRQPFDGGKVRGTELEFAFTERDVVTRVDGRINGDRINAKVTRGNETANYIAMRMRARDSG